jgi:hypothetical protein
MWVGRGPLLLQESDSAVGRLANGVMLPVSISTNAACVACAGSRPDALVRAVVHGRRAPAGGVGRRRARRGEQRGQVSGA